MNYYIELSDKRNQYLYGLMKNRGFSVFELSKGELGCAYVFSPAKKLIADDIDNLCEKTTVYAGNVTDEVKSCLLEREIKHINFFSGDEFADKNAALTAEGVLSLLISKTPRSIFKNKILLLGNGRCAKAIINLFKPLQLDYMVASRTEGIDTDRYIYMKTDWTEKLSEFDVIINTIPARVLDDAALSLIDKNAVYLEIASVKTVNSETVPFSYIPSPGLPAIFSPESAAEVMLDLIE